jgi:hypothetical protein
VCGGGDDRESKTSTDKTQGTRTDEDEGQVVGSVILRSGQDGGEIGGVSLRMFQGLQATPDTAVYEHRTWKTWNPLMSVWFREGEKVDRLMVRASRASEHSPDLGRLPALHHGTQRDPSPCPIFKHS